MLKWVKRNPRKAVTAGAILAGGLGTATGAVPLQALAGVLAQLAPLLGG